MKTKHFSEYLIYMDWRNYWTLTTTIRAISRYCHLKNVKILKLSSFVHHTGMIRLLLLAISSKKIASVLSHVFVFLWNCTCSYISYSKLKKWNSSPFLPPPLSFSFSRYYKNFAKQTITKYILLFFLFLYSEHFLSYEK